MTKEERYIVSLQCKHCKTAILKTNPMTEDEITSNDRELKRNQTLLDIKFKRDGCPSDNGCKTKDGDEFADIEMVKELA